jgi:hypothetical protein
MDEEGGFGGVAGGTSWVPVGRYWVALLFHFSSAYHNFVIDRGTTYKYHNARKYNSPDSNEADTEVDDAAVGGGDSEPEVEEEDGKLSEGGRECEEELGQVY